MLSLIAKDFKLMFAKNGNKTNKLLSILFLCIAGLLFIAIETYLFINILKRIEIYPGANNIIFTIFLFVVTMILSLMCIFTSRKLFFDEEDAKQLAHYPISSEKKIISKLFFLFITMYLLNLVFSLPLFIAYGTMFNKRLFYFYTALYYPLLVSIFEIGLALIFVFPVKLLMDYLQKNPWIRLVVVLLISFVLTFAYSKVLNMFIDMVANNELTMIFTDESIANLTKVSRAMVPINFLVATFTSGNGFFPFISISLGIFIIGVILIIYFYTRFINFKVYEKAKSVKHDFSVLKPREALVKKELLLLFRSSDILFSFVGLAFVEPFLCFLVVKAINTIFSSGSLNYALLAVPNMLPIMDIFVMMLLTGIISSGASSYIEEERGSLKTMKIIPVDPQMQIAIKVLIPYVFSILLMFISFIVLVAAKTISSSTFIFGFILCLVLITLLTIVSLYEELRISKSKPRSHLFSTLYMYVLPFILFGLGLLLAYIKVNIYLIYLIDLAILGIVYLPFVIKWKSRLTNLFIDLEVAN